MHIVAYLGYLIGSDRTGGHRYVIISRDKDYDKIIDFLEKETGVKVERTASIDPAAAKKAENRGTKRGHAGKKSSGSTASRSGKSSTGHKNEVPAAGSDERTPRKTGNHHRSNYRGKNRRTFESGYSADKKTVAPAETVSSAGSGVKTVTAENKKTGPAPNIKTRINQDIQKNLSTAGMSADIANYVASAAVKNAGEKNGKQLTYQTIVEKYGMVKGLKIYRHVKKLIP